MINIRMNTTEHSSKKLSPKITVIGVGGAGGNAVNNMISSNLSGVDFVVCNTDAQALVGNLADHKVQLGTALTEGLGAGAKPEIGRAAAEESLDEVMQYLEDANMAFITAGMGGGTGTGAAAVLAKACRERGILTVGVVTKPFHFEGSRRMKQAEDGLADLQNYVDTLIVIPNQNLFRVVNEKTTFADGFKMADSVLQSAVRGVTDLIVKEGLINLDFADIRSVMQEMGKAVMGAGEATGENRATEAAEKAISNPLLDDVSMKGAKGVIVNITGGYDMTLFEVDEACNRIRDEVDPNANIIFGSTFDESMEGKIRVSVVATGIDAAVSERKSTRISGSASSTSAVPSSGIFTAERSRLRPEPIEQMAATAAVRTPAPQIAPVQAQPQAFTQPAAQPYQVATASVAQSQFSQALRGARVGEAYIPPQPVAAASGYAQQMAQGVYTSQQQSYTRTADVTPQQSKPYSEAAQQQAPQQRRKSSLFERITSGYRRMEASIESFQTENDINSDDEGDNGSASSGGTSGYAPTMRSQQRTAPTIPASSSYVSSSPTQGRLNIDSPVGLKEEDELEIPAFLRRQTS